MSSPEVLKNIGELLLHSKRITANSDDICIEDAADWLSSEYLTKCLRSYYKDEKLKVLKMHAKPALGKGENYGGVLTRVKAEFQLSNKKSSIQTGNYIVKTSFEGNEFACKTMEPYDIFNREIKIYEELLPKFKLLLQQMGDKEQIFAETITVDKEKSALIFEDLNARDLRMPDRLRGLNMDVTKIVLRKIAKMHACSVVVNEREHKALELYDCGMFNRHTDNYAPGFVGGLEACSRRVAQWPEFKQISDKLIKLIPKYMELSKQVFDPLAKHFNVFCHGDLWTNNILVNYDPITNEALDVIIIDFQYSVWGSPAIDLFYLFNSSLTDDTMINKQDELIQFYYQHLAETLEKLEYHAKLPSLFRFHQQLQEKSFYAFHCCCVVQPIQRNVVNDDADFNALMQTDERAIRFKNTCYANPYIQDILRKMLPVYERRGLLDDDQ